MTKIKSAEESHTNFGLQDPSFYHRQYEHDIQKPDEPKTAFDQCKRVATVALPFIGLCKPFAKPLSFAMDGLRGVFSLSSLVEGIQEGNSGQIASGMINTAVSVAAIAVTIFSSPLGMLITTGHDLTLNSVHLFHALNEKDYKKATEMGAQIVASSLYLGMFFTGEIELSMLATSAQILIGIYRSSEDFQKGNILETCGHLAMVMLKNRELVGQVNFREKIMQHLIESNLKKSSPIELAFVKSDYELADYFLQMREKALNLKKSTFEFPGYEFSRSFREGKYPLWQKPVPVKIRGGGNGVYIDMLNRVDTEAIRILIKYDSKNLWRKHLCDWLSQSYHLGDLESIAVLYPLTKKANINISFSNGEQRYLIDPFLSNIPIDREDYTHFYIPGYRPKENHPRSVFDYRVEDNVRIKELKTQIQEMLIQPNAYP